MKKLIASIFIFISGGCFSQNGIGMSVGYENVQTTEWNKIISVFNSADTVHKGLTKFAHLPVASLFYERKFEEYLYFQLSGNYSYSLLKATTLHGDLSITIQMAGVALSCNWYPVKMMKGIKKTPFNPMLLHFGFGANYMLSVLTHNNEKVFESDKNNFTYNQVPLLASAGLGYDLNFGKRIIFQPVFYGRYYLNLELPELNHLVPTAEQSGYKTLAPAMAYGFKAAFIYIF